MPKRTRRPTSPGEILRYEFLEPRELTQRELANHIGCEVKAINRLVNGRSRVSAKMALALGSAFETTPQFWLNLQNSLDLFDAPKPGHGSLGLSGREGASPG